MPSDFIVRFVETMDKYSVPPKDRWVKEEDIEKLRKVMLEVLREIC